MKNNQGETPLHIAVQHGCKEAVSLLLDLNVFCFSKDNKGMTPFDVAMKLHNKPISDLLQGFFLFSKAIFNFQENKKLCLSSLPDLILQKIFRKCDSFALLMLSYVCKKFQQVSQQDELWKIKTKSLNVLGTKILVFFSIKDREKVKKNYKKAYMAYINTWIQYAEKINWNQWRSPPVKTDKDKKRIYDVEVSMVIIGEQKTGKTSALQKITV